jgi:hypothetical protein
MRYFIYLLLITFIFFGCKKDNINHGDPNIPENIKELNPSDNFDWETNMLVTIRIEGVETDVKIANTLFIKDADGNIYLKKMYDMSTSEDIEVCIPSVVKKLYIDYGSFHEKIQISGNYVEFSFIPDIPNVLDN